MTDILAPISTEELTRAVGFLSCERMIYSRPALVEAKIDALIALYEAEVALRADRSVPSPTPKTAA